VAKVNSRLNIIDIKKCGIAMDGDLNPKVKAKGSVLILVIYDT
jgi:hypothetical protein